MTDDERLETHICVDGKQSPGSRDVCRHRSCYEHLGPPRNAPAISTAETATVALLADVEHIRANAGDESCAGYLLRARDAERRLEELTAEYDEKLADVTAARQGDLRSGEAMSVNPHATAAARWQRLERVAPLPRLCNYCDREFIATQRITVVERRGQLPLAMICPFIERVFSDGYWKCCLPAGAHVTHWLVWVRRERECTTY